MKRLFPFISLLLLFACAPKVQTRLIATAPPLEYFQEVVVIGLDEKVPASAIELGTVKVGDKGLTIDCGWKVVIEEAKTAARKAGGNMLKLTVVKHPSPFTNTCYRITATILKVEDADNLDHIKANRGHSVNQWNYAKLFVYSSGRSDIPYDYPLYLDDAMLFNVKNNFRREIRLTTEGTYMLWAETGAKTEIPINIKFGREYYVWCSIENYLSDTRPLLQLVDRIQGRDEYNSIIKKK